MKIKHEGKNLIIYKDDVISYTVVVKDKISGLKVKYHAGNYNIYLLAGGEIYLDCVEGDVEDGYNEAIKLLIKYKKEIGI